VAVLVGDRHTPCEVWECDTDDGEHRLSWWTAETGSDELTLDAGEVGEARWVAPHEFSRLEPAFAGDREFFEKVFPALA
jgi:hypothetical protein